jgi:hypothetical protein
MVRVVNNLIVILDNNPNGYIGMDAKVHAYYCNSTGNNYTITHYGHVDGSSFNLP